jgi:hypothetical protein
MIRCNLSSGNGEPSPKVTLLKWTASGCNLLWRRLYNTNSIKKKRLNWLSHKIWPRGGGKVTYIIWKLFVMWLNHTFRPCWGCTRIAGDLSFVSRLSFGSHSQVKPSFVISFYEKHKNRLTLVYSMKTKPFHLYRKKNWFLTSACFFVLAHKLFFQPLPFPSFMSYSDIYLVYNTP